MQNKIMLKDVAVRAGVSVATASLALNGKQNINKETAERVFQAAADLNYKLDQNRIRTVATEKKKLIGLIVPNVENPYFGKIIKAVQSELNSKDYDLFIAVSDENIQREQDIVDSFIKKEVDGILVVPVSNAIYETDHYLKLDKQKIPYVFLTAYYPSLKNSYVMCDLEEGAYREARYMLDLGRRNIAFLIGSERVVSTSLRMEGYRRAFKERGLRINEDWLIYCRRQDFEQAYLLVSKLLEEEQNLDAIISINDIMALGALNALVENEIRVPEKISVCGYDNVQFSSISTIPITTVSQDTKQIGWNAVNMLQMKIRQERVINDEILIAPQLIIRQSTGRKESEVF